MGEDRHRIAFEAGAAAWERYTRSPLGRLREGLTMQHLLSSLASRGVGLRVLDAGAGSGGYALALAQAGQRVWLVDFAPTMLALARERLAAAGETILDRATFLCCRVDEIPDCVVGLGFDVILCHTLLEYVARPEEMLVRLVSMLAPGGTLSLLLANPAAEALNLALAKRDLVRALRALPGIERADDATETDAATPDVTTPPAGRADLFGLPRVTLAPERVRTILRAAGLTVAAEYGIRVVADYYSAAELADATFYERLWAFEAAAGSREPYRRMARYLQIIAEK